MVWNYQNADCSLRKKFIVSFTIIFGTLSFSIHRVNQNLWPLYDLHFLGITRHNVWSWWVKICRVVSIKFNHLVYENVCMIVKMYLCDITVANISESFTHKMAAKTSWHRYESKLRHCHPVYSNIAQCVCVARWKWRSCVRACDAVWQRRRSRTAPAIHRRLATTGYSRHLTCKRPICTAAFCIITPAPRGGSVAEWLACWTQAQNGLGSNRSRDAVG